ncbi:hypothetical protein D3C81_1589080 [compost metagenome]
MEVSPDVDDPAIDGVPTPAIAAEWQLVSRSGEALATLLDQVTDGHFAEAILQVTSYYLPAVSAL